GDTGVGVLHARGTAESVHDDLRSFLLAQPGAVDGSDPKHKLLDQEQRVRPPQGAEVIHQKVRSDEDGPPDLHGLFDVLEHPPNAEVPAALRRQAELQSLEGVLDTEEVPVVIQWAWSV